MEFEITKRWVGAAILLGIPLGALQYQCDTRQARQQEAQAAKAAKATPEQTLAMLGAHASVRKAHRMAVYDALREVNRKLEVMQQQHNAKMPSADKADVISIVFTANNRGEREDCGCKHHPMGGLSRRQTLIDLAQDPTTRDARKWWGGGLAKTDARFVVDAGDLMFRSATLVHNPPGLQKEARKDARAVAAVLATHPPDAANVGELDLVFGLDTYKKVAGAAHLPVVSANLYSTDGERPFAGHRVVSRGGKKVAFIGLIKSKSRVMGYYKKRALVVKPPQKAYVDELAKLPDDVDLVVLLSNLGVKDTTTLVENLRHANKRVDAAIVSNTNRLTRTPVWAAKMPVVEPLSRGKYLGRLEFRLGESPGISYADAHRDPREVVQEYRRAWTGYFEAGAKHNQSAAEIARLQKQLASTKDKLETAPDEADLAKAKPTTDKPKKTKQELQAHIKHIQSRIEYLKKLLVTLDKRVETTSQTLVHQGRDLSGIEGLVKYNDGDDWASVRVVPLAIKIPQDKQVRRILDRYARK